MLQQVRPACPPGCHKHAAGAVLAGPKPRGISASKLDFLFILPLKRKRIESIREASPWAYRPVLGPTCTHRALSLRISVRPGIGPPRGVLLLLYFN